MHVEEVVSQSGQNMLKNLGPIQSIKPYSPWLCRAMHCSSRKAVKTTLGPIVPFPPSCETLKLEKNRGFNPAKRPSPSRLPPADPVGTPRHRWARLEGRRWGHRLRRPTTHAMGAEAGGSKELAVALGKDVGDELTCLSPAQTNAYYCYLYAFAGPNLGTLGCFCCFGAHCFVVSALEFQHLGTGRSVEAYCLCSDAPRENRGGSKSWRNIGSFWGRRLTALSSAFRGFTV